MTFDVFNVFPRHYLKCFPLPNQQHCSVLIDLAIRCNWPSITFHSKLIFISVPSQGKDNVVCQSRDSDGLGLLKRTLQGSGEVMSPPTVPTWPHTNREHPAPQWWVHNHTSMCSQWMQLLSADCPPLSGATVTPP